MSTLLSTIKALFALTVIAVFSVAVLNHSSEETSTVSEESKTHHPETVDIENISTPIEAEEPKETARIVTDPEPSEPAAKKIPHEVEIETPLLPSPPPINVDFSDINEHVRNSVVNILCEMREGRTIRTITGSGVIIDKRGIILTNAHIAQFFLLTDYPQENATQCKIRTGNPAESRYKAELLYIPITWVHANADNAGIEVPLGTGEGDYALLYITEPTDTTTNRPTTFPSLPVNTLENEVDTGEAVLIASYPALIANSKAIKDKLYLVSTPTRINMLFTFREGTLDLFGLSGNIAAQKGSSGGAVVNADGRLVGLVVTSTNASFLLERELRALTPAYIDRSLVKENGTTFDQMLLGDIALRAKAFNLSTSPLLTKLLTDALDAN